MNKKNKIEALRKDFTDSTTFSETKLKSAQMIAWCKHSKTELFTSISLTSLMSITELKLLHGYQPIDEPLSAGTLPDGRFYRFLTKPEHVLAKENVELNEKVKRDYLKHLEIKAVVELSSLIENVVDIQRNAQADAKETL